MSAKILVFSGSARKESLNKRLAKAATKILNEQGAEATFLELGDYPMPIYHGDVEADDGVPEQAKQVEEILQAHEGIVIASPEYNGTFSPLLKNSIDWITRIGRGAFRGKTAVLLSAAPGALGGLRGLVQTRAMLSSIGVIVLPEQLAVAKAREAFDESGELIEESYKERLTQIAQKLIDVTEKLNG